MHYLSRSVVTILVIAFAATSSAQGVSATRQVNFLRDALKTPDVAWQAQLRKASAWQGFLAEHPGWNVEFNEASSKPHRAYGPPIPTSGADAQERALTFASQELHRFGIPVEELVHAATIPTEKFQYVHFAQHHQGVPVIKGYLLVKMDDQGRVVLFGTEVHDSIELDMQASFPESSALANASEGLENIVFGEVLGLRVLPIPEARRSVYHLVHEVMVHTLDADLPGHYLCWVDAHNGALLYRWDQVTSGCFHGSDNASGINSGAGADVSVLGDVKLNGPNQPVVTEGLRDLRLTINGEFFFTDGDGFLPTGIPGPVDATVQLRGRWSNVTTNNVTPSFTTTLQEGQNDLTFNNAANVRERTAYFAVSEIHEHMKTTLPSFTGMDIVLPTKVDLTTGDCNAFYDGSSINFYAEANNCHASSLFPDVVYHEYGHGINDKFYQSLSNNFTNGAMNEGYADVWALTLTNYPILSEGWYIDNPSSSIRRYDQDPKVYPVNLVGQVHADGEIIAGAWWDTKVLLNDDELLLDLFAEAFPGLQATALNGQEGQAFRDVLIDVLQADDDDMDITNGTPHGDAIVEGFAIHGITLLSNVNVQHDALVSAPADEDIPITANVVINFPFTNYLSGVRAFYRLNNEPDWNSVLMTNTSGTVYGASIPAQPEGTVIAYYLAVEDIFGQLSSVQPVAAAQADPNLPYYILVGYALQATEDADLTHQLGDWTAGLPEDNATTGMWEQNVPLASWSGDNGTGIMVQPGYQHTEGGEFCWVTQNATSEFAGFGESDVDGGSTTLLSGVIDLTGYDNPAITYWRWYSNDPPGGANPGTDWWQVYISENGGSSWVPLEDTKASDRSWRRNAFRVADHVQLTSEFRIKFIASDSIRPGQNLEGGSLIEAALDDIQVWDVGESTIGMQDLSGAVFLGVYPDPTSDRLNIELDLNGVLDPRLDVLDITGRIVRSPVLRDGSSASRHVIDVSRLAEGQYVLRLVWQGGSAERRFTVVR